MKNYEVWRSILVVLVGSSLLLAFSVTFAQQGKGPSDEMIRGAFQQILAEVDRNHDGKLSREECMSVSRDKVKMEKDCGYWDANGDGIILEGEYIQQVRKIFK